MSPDPDIPKERKILHNRARCKKCGTVVESQYRHDFRWCPCKSMAVDGGRAYLRRVGDIDQIEELSEFET